jgi:hypothetical protein
VALCAALWFPVDSGGTAAARAKPHDQSPRICVFDRMSLHSAPGTCRPQATSYPPNVTGSVKRAIYDSAMTFGVPYQVLLEIAKCESSLNPNARDGKHYGLFQFLPSTFREGQRAMQTMTGIQAHTYWNPLDASYVAGFLFAVGKANRWACLSQVQRH